MENASKDAMGNRSCTHSKAIGSCMCRRWWHSRFAHSGSGRARSSRSARPNCAKRTSAGSSGVGLTSAHLVQLAFPALQDLPLLAPPPERSFTELIVAPEVALTKLPATNGALTARTDPAPVLSPSQVRCFFDCPARWWFKYGLQLPERKNSSLALGLAVHQALEVNFREKLETREDLETTGVVCGFREAWMEQVPQPEFPSDESQGDLRRLGERLVAKYMDEVAPKVEPAAVELDVQGEISGVQVRGRVDAGDLTLYIEF